MSAQLSDFISDAQRAAVLEDRSFDRRLPGLVFRSPEFLRFEYQRWLQRTWLFVGRGADISHAGDATPVPGMPVFLARTETGAVKAFHNACRHRGHRLIAKPCESLSRIICPYHHWTYSLDGELMHTPNAGGAKNHELDGLDKQQHSLRAVRCEMWHDWIFINLDGNADSLADFVAPIADQLSFVHFGELRHFLTMHRKPIPANWKICMENTMEPYHVPIVHKSSAAGQPLELHYMIEDDPVMGCGIDIPGSSYTNKPATADEDMTNLDMSARYLVRMPNFFLTSYAPDVIVDTMLVPDYADPKRCWLEQAWYTTSGRVPSAQEVAVWEELEEQVMAEDITVMGEVQAGVESEAVDDGGVLTPSWESCISGFYRHMVQRLEAD